MNPPIFIALLYAFIGAVVLGVSIPLIRERVGMNNYYGIRFPAAFESDEAWYRINRHGGKCFAWYGAVLLAAAPFAWLLIPVDIPFRTMNIFAMMPVILLVPTVIASAFYPRS
jgi:uncharacterized membrane protein